MGKINQEEYEALKAWWARRGMEMTKDKEWLKKEIKFDKDTSYPNYISKRRVYDLLDQLDEPELLTQEWIESKTWNNHYVGDPFVFVDDLQNLLVPKQEEVTEEAHEKYGVSETRWKEVIERYKWHLEQEGYAVIEKPTVPQFVADWIEKCKEKNKTLSQVYIDMGMSEVNVIKWLYHEGDRSEKVDLLAKAWLAYPNIEVEKEPQVIKITEDLYLVEPLGYMTGDIVYATRNKKYAYKFTDQDSINAHLEKFTGAKAVPVEEED